MTVKAWSLREHLIAALGCLLMGGATSACNNPAPSEDTMSSANGAAGVAGSKANGAAAGQGAAGAAGSGTAGQPATAGRIATASAGRGGAAGAEDDVDAGSGENTAGAPAAGRAGMTAAAAGSGGSAGAGSEVAAVKPPCLDKPSQLVAIGDSYLNYFITHTFPDDLRTAFGAEYRMYAVGGASMGSGGISGFVPDQLTQAISEDKDILAVVMTGGGNDILIADTEKYPGSDTCKDRTDAPMDKVCQDVIANAMDTAGKLMDTAAAAGIRDVVYLFYPHIPGGGFGGMNPNAIMDYALPLARDMCEGAAKRTENQLHCHFLNLVPVFDGHPDWFADDGIHENSLGSAAMAKEVVNVLKEKCVAQPESSGCCTP